MNSASGHFGQGGQKGHFHGGFNKENNACEQISISVLYLWLQSPPAILSVIRVSNDFPFKWDIISMSGSYVTLEERQVGKVTYVPDETSPYR
jgi:hypothetical protein